MDPYHCIEEFGKLRRLTGNSTVLGEFWEYQVRDSLQEYVERVHSARTLRVSSGIVHPLQGVDGPANRSGHEVAASKRGQCDIILYENTPGKVQEFCAGRLVVADPSAVRAVIEVTTTVSSSTLLKKLDQLWHIKQNNADILIYMFILDLRETTENAIAVKLESLGEQGRPLPSATLILGKYCNLLSKECLDGSICIDIIYGASYSKEEALAREPASEVSILMEAQTGVPRLIDLWGGSLGVFFERILDDLQDSLEQRCSEEVLDLDIDF